MRATVIQWAGSPVQLGVKRHIRHHGTLPNKSQTVGVMFYTEGMEPEPELGPNPSCSSLLSLKHVWETAGHLDFALPSGFWTPWGMMLSRLRILQSCYPKVLGGDTGVCHICTHSWWLSGKESACSAEDSGSIPGSGRSFGERNGNPLFSILAGETPWAEEPDGLEFIW